MNPVSKVSSIEQILADYKAGKMVILVDDEQRENEGDLVISVRVRQISPRP
jgi:3,4-dihydroxy-2-butanone 4-phosphate synthase